MVVHTAKISVREEPVRTRRSSAPIGLAELGEETNAGKSQLSKLLQRPRLPGFRDTRRGY